MSRFFDTRLPSDLERHEQEFADNRLTVVVVAVLTVWGFVIGFIVGLLVGVAWL